MGFRALSSVSAKRKRRRKEEWKHPYFAFNGLNARAEGGISQLEPARLEAQKVTVEQRRSHFPQRNLIVPQEFLETEKMRRRLFTQSSLRSLIIVKICSSVLFALFIFISPCYDAL